MLQNCKKSQMKERQLGRVYVHYDMQIYKTLPYLSGISDKYTLNLVGQDIYIFKETGSR